MTSDIWVAIETRGWVPLEFRTEPELMAGRLSGFNTIITERQREEEATRLIEDVRRTLVNTSPHRVNLQAIAELIGARFADVCLIESIDVVGQLTLLGVQGSGEAVKVVRKGRQPGSNCTRGAPVVARTAEPDMQTLRRSMLDPPSNLGSEYCSFLRDLEPSAYISVPLRAKTTLLGVMTLVMRETGRGYDERDLRVAQELAGSIAWVLENSRQLAETQRQIQLRQDLLALVAHDLRTPLNALRVATELSFREARHDHHQLHQLESMRLSVDTMARMIEDLLDFSSVEAGRLSIQRETCELRGLFNAAVEMLRPAVTRRGKNITLRIGDDLPSARVVCDHHRILQVLINLGENAIKFTDDGEITFSAALVGEEVHVTVQDSGRGIPADLLPYVFERYWRPRRESSAGGRGLGLFIVRGIIESHDGRIWVESEPGQGARFIFALPQAHAFAPATMLPEPTQPHATEHAEDRSILIVEDDAESRSLMRELLTRHRYRVHTASDGREALELSRVLKPSLILLDLSMPTMDGTTFVRHARADAALRGVPIVLMSGDTDLRTTARELQVAAFTQKPIQIEKLLTIIASVLG